MKRSQSGNAVVFILLAVALFGALAYTFMRGGQTGQSNISASQAKMGAQDILNYGKQVERAVDKLRQRGCSENQISFEGSYLPGGSPHSFANFKAPGDKTCHVFDAAGGGLTDKQFTKLMTPTSSRKVGYNMFINANNIQDIGTAKPDLLLIVPDLTLEVCNSINQILGITGEMTTEDTHITAADGTYPATAATTIGDNGVNPDTVKGRNSFCMQQWYPFYEFVQVLIAR